MPLRLFFSCIVFFSLCGFHSSQVFAQATPSKTSYPFFYVNSIRILKDKEDLFHGTLYWNANKVSPQEYGSINEITIGNIPLYFDSMIDWIYDREIGKWRYNGKRDSIVYNKYGDMTEHVAANFYEGSWHNVEKHRLSFDQDHRESNLMSWNWIDNQWLDYTGGSYKQDYIGETYKYDKYGNNTSSPGRRNVYNNEYQLKSVTYYHSTEPIEISGIRTIEYSPDGFPAIQRYETLGNGKVTHSSQDVYSYDSSGNLLSETHQLWNGEEWISQWKLNMKWNDLHEQTEIVTMNNTDGKWSTSYHKQCEIARDSITTSFLDPEGKITNKIRLQEEWTKDGIRIITKQVTDNSKEWTNSERTTIRYDQRGFEIYILTEAWVSGHWVDSKLGKVLFDDNGRANGRIKLEWDSQSGEIIRGDSTHYYMRDSASLDQIRKPVEPVIISLDRGSNVIDIRSSKNMRVVEVLNGYGLKVNSNKDRGKKSTRIDLSGHHYGKYKVIVVCGKKRYAQTISLMK